MAAICATTTGTGLHVNAELDTGTYPSGVPVSDEQMAALPLTRHEWHGDGELHPAPSAAGIAATARTAARLRRTPRLGYKPLMAR